MEDLLGIMTNISIVSFFYLKKIISDGQHSEKIEEEYDTKSEIVTSTEDDSKFLTDNQIKLTSISGKNFKRNSKRSDKSKYSHNWLLTTLKGHRGAVLDMEISGNGENRLYF